MRRVTDRRPLWIFGGAVLLTVVLFAGLGYLPMLRRIADWRERAAAVEADLDREMRLSGQFEALTPAQQEELAAFTAMIWQRIPAEENVPELLVEISRLAEEQGISRLRIAHEGSRPLTTLHLPAGEGRAEMRRYRCLRIPMELTFDAPHDACLRFLLALEGLERLLGIEEIRITEGDEGLRVELRISAYALQAEGGAA
jgi:Tfp pilus assembly protein PilO